MTFGDDPLFLDTIPAFLGQHLLGFMVVDLDGNTYLEDIVLTVVED
jgi:hypothetical protein